MPKMKSVYEYSEHMKWLAEGFDNLTDIAAVLESVAGHFKEMAATGAVYMTQPVDNGHIWLETRDSDIAERFGFWVPEYEEEDEWDEDDDDRIVE